MAVAVQKQKDMITQKRVIMVKKTTHHVHSFWSVYAANRPLSPIKKKNSQKAPRINITKIQCEINGECLGTFFILNR